MYRYQDIKEIHFEITTKCQARCPQCPRRVPGGGVLNPFITLDEVSLDQFKEWFPEDFLKQLTKFFMCGNLGDPIIARDTLAIFEYLREINPKILLAMNTNGSARDKHFWQRLGELDLDIMFGIDGLEDTHHLYRVGTDWHKIMDNIKTFISAGGRAHWHMLVFKHNEHQVEECRQLSKDMGFRWFDAKHSTRWTAFELAVIDDTGKRLHTIEPSNYSIEMHYKQETVKQVHTVINCKAVGYKQIYVSANGNVNPCCWLDLEWVNPWQQSRIDYIEKINSFPNLNKSSLEEIFEKGHFDAIESTWGIKPLQECSKQCGAFDKHREQFIDGFIEG